MIKIVLSCLVLVQTFALSAFAKPEDRLNLGREDAIYSKFISELIDKGSNKEQDPNEKSIKLTGIKPFRAADEPCYVEIIREINQFETVYLSPNEMSRWRQGDWGFSGYRRNTWNTCSPSSHQLYPSSAYSDGLGSDCSNKPSNSEIADDAKPRKVITNPYLRIKIAGSDDVRANALFEGYSYFTTAHHGLKFYSSAKVIEQTQDYMEFEIAQKALDNKEISAGRIKFEMDQERRLRSITFTQSAGSEDHPKKSTWSCYFSVPTSP